MRPAFAGPTPAPLLATLPYEGLANHICGYAVRYWRFSPKKVAVLAALLAYLQEHSNRVWPSEETLANLALVSVRTVRRVKAFLRDYLNLHPVAADELHSGPGPQDFKGPKRSDRQVDTLDLTPMLAMLAPGELEKLAHATRRPNAEPDAAPPAQNSQTVAPRPALIDETGLPDPLSEPDAPEGDTHFSAKAENPNPSAVPFLHRRPASICNVPIEIKAQKESEGRPAEAPENLKNAMAATASKTVLRPTVAHIVEGGAGRGHLALRQIGVWEKTCGEIVTDWGEARAYKLARYAWWAKHVAHLIKPSGNMAGYARKTWKQFGGWLPKFEDWFKEQDKAAHQQAELDAQTRAAARVKVVAAPAKAIEEPIPEAYLDRAFAETMAKAKPENRKRTRERGKNHAFVQALARQMMRREEGDA